MWLSGSVAQAGSRNGFRKVPVRRQSLPRRYRRRYGRENEAVLILILFLLLIVVLFYFS